MSQLNSIYYETDDTILIQTLGTIAEDVAANHWIFNAATSYKVEKLDLIDQNNFRYRVTFKSEHIFKIGDSLTITGSGGLNVQSKIYSVTGAKQVTIGDQGRISASVESLTIKINLTKCKFKNHDVGNLVSDVQNVYKKGDRVLVASSSLPGSETNILIDKEFIQFSGTFPPTGTAKTDTFKVKTTGDHGFYTGDVVYYKPQVVTTTSTDIDGNTVTTTTVQTGIAEEGIYFVQRLSDTTELKLARSRSELYSGIYVTTEPITVTDNTITRYEFNDEDLENQKIFREIPRHIHADESPETKTLPGTKNAILANGVEVLNYKSLDFIHYNKIEKIIAEKSGEGYDIINPPNIVISDSTGVGATANARIRGSFSRFDLIDGGFDYVDVPTVTISGGNGKNAVAEVNTKLIEHKVDFNSEARFGLVDTSANTISFSTYHKFRDYDKVIYQSNGGAGVAGLTTGASYYVSVQNSTSVKFHKTYDDAVAEINPISITGFGIGRHTILAETPKRVISAINVVDAGEGYETNKTTVSGVSTALNRITITDHGYTTGEKIVYSTTETEIGGLTSGTEYYVYTFDKDTIQLAEVGPSGNVEKNLNEAQYINLTSTQTGIHNFNYKDITVTVGGQIGVGGTISTDTFRASFTPIVRGEIIAANMQDKGVGYGSSEVINFIRIPDVTIQVGSEAQFQPIVDATGQIVQVIVQNGGADINAAPKLKAVSDTGEGCVLSPVISGNRITSVEILNKGYGYVAGKTTISVEYPGSGAKLTPVIQTWNINEYQRRLPSIQSDDGVLTRPLNEEFGIQYAYLFAPRDLRQKLYTSTSDGVVQYNSSDLTIENGAEKLTSTNHSAIIGWAYDGSPIYGPFGYNKKSGGVVTQLKSGYEVSLKPNRPPLSVFPEGFFVEDYTYVASADETVLDQNNGRFCVTPEYPNGTYAYFATLSENIASQGLFAKFKEPQFPYLIGENLHTTPDRLNYLKSTNHDDFSIETHGWIRNTKYYNLDNEVSNYAYVERPYKLTNNQISEVTYASPGGVDYIGILTGGKNYKVNDSLIFNENGSGGYGVDVRVSRVGGKVVSQISCATTSTNSVEVIPTGTSGVYKLYTDSPHGYKNAELVAISGVSTSRVNLAGQYRAGISTITFALRSGIETSSTTGIVTYFPIYASNIDAIDENDIFLVGDEKVKILNVDKVSNRVRVLRAVEGTTGSAHTASTVGYEDTRKFTARIGFKTTFDFQRNRQLYFNPADTVARGTSVGIGTTITFTNPGSGSTNVFAQSKSLYIPGHGLKTGDELVYNTNGGDGIIYNEPNNVGVATTFTDGQRVFAARISDDLIGISTVKVGLGSTGTFVGVGTTTSTQSTVFFTGVGTGINHSFTTIYPNVVTVTSAQNVVTVSTASTHGLLPNDEVLIDVRPSAASTISVSYNDYNRRLVIDKKDVLAAGISTITDEITIADHGYVSGQPIIYTAATPAGGLTNEKIYYVIVSDKDTIKLSETYNGSIAIVPLSVNITQSQDSSFSPVNPPIKVYKDQSIEFDLSDTSLTFTTNSITYPAFKFVLYTDDLLTHEYHKPVSTEVFDVSSTGVVGTDGKVTLTLREEPPSLLYYQLVPVDNTAIPVSKSQIISDKETVNYNQLIVSDSLYSGKYNVTVSTPTEFKYFISSIPESTSYTSTNALLHYNTSSVTGIGSIASLRTFNSGANYSKLPSIEGVVSGIGSQAAFEISSDTIGVIMKTRLRNIGFDYPYDQTLRPQAKLPELLKINKFGILESVGVTSYGFGYGSVAPKVLLFDGVTGEEKTEVDLEFTFGSNQLTIIRNTFGVNPVQPKLLPTKNTNGVGIDEITYDSSTKEVYVTLNTGFTTANSFPFEVGDEVMVENVSVGIASTVAGQTVFVPSGDGFNSKDYGYKLFTVTAVDANLGGIGTMAYSLDGIIADGASPGTVNLSKSAGRIIPKKHFPTFDVTLTTSGFIDGEDLKNLTDTDVSGVIETWDGANGYLKVRTTKAFSKNDVVEGQSSRSRGTVVSTTKFDASYDIEATSIFENGWDDVSGFLNNPQQVIQDSDYYQHFSYALKSRIDMDEWDELVGSLNHASGFKRFSNLVIETTDDLGGAVVGLGTTTYFSKIIDFIGNIDLNCVYNFDNVTENDKDGFSDKIFFKNQILTDYEQSTGNRVLNVDNVADEFNSNPRPTRYGEVATWDITQVKANKFLVYIQDAQYNSESQVGVVNVLTDDNDVTYITQYGDIDTVDTNLGYFDVSASGVTGALRFFPTKYENNNYNVYILQYGFLDIDTSIGNTYFGGSVNLFSTSETVSVGSTTTLVSIGTTFQAAKILLEISTADGEHEFEELTVSHDGTTADLLEYGQICSAGGGAFNYSGTSGFGTYHPYIDGSTLKVDFIPNISVASTVNTIAVAISSEGSGAGSLGLRQATLGAVSPVSIASSSSPTTNTIASYTNDDFNSAYYIVQVSDPDNNHHQVSEVIVLDKGPDFADETFNNEYAVLTSDLAPRAGLGTFGTEVNGSNVDLVFTPNENINVTVSCYYNFLKNQNPAADDQTLDFTNTFITSQFGTYAATNADVKRSFSLTYQGYNVFERYIDAEDAVVIGAASSSAVTDAINIPNHFFVTGEKLSYATVGSGTTQNISIASTNVSGIGVTDKLPSTVYAINVDSNNIRLTDTAEKALKFVPEYFDIDGVGIGNSHKFTATNQNARCLIAIDNYVQSPIVATAVTFALAQEMLSSSDDLFLTGITSITGGDLFQVDNEIMKVKSVGVGSTNAVRVQREELGTLRVTHSLGTLATKIEGNYNITNNTLNFVEAPYGNNPISTTTASPDERDWTGITTSSTFQARVFLKTGTPGATVDTYSNNYVFDDVSDQFTGTDDTFALKVHGVDKTGFENDNAILLLNDLIQTPGLNENFTLAEQAGITSAVFVSDGQVPTYDINTVNLPGGGVIVSVGDSSGSGYQPRVSAGGTATVSAAGTVSSISIGSTGSGVRAAEVYDIQTSIATTVAAGSTVMTIANENSVFKFLEFNAGAASSIGVGTFFGRPTSFISVGTTSVNIGIGSTSSQEIPAGTSAFVRLFNPTVGVVRVGVASSSVGIRTETHIGVATISAGHLLETVHITNVGSGYTSTLLPEVIIEEPLTYDNIPLIYQTDGLAQASTGVGTQAKIDFTVGFESDVIDFSVSNTGFGYQPGQTLTVPVGGPTGIPTDPTVGGNFERFSIEISKVFTDKFSAWTVGQLQAIDDISGDFDGVT